MSAATRGDSVAARMPVDHDDIVAVIPVYDHEHAIAAMVAGVRAQGLPVLLVDDGSHAACAQALDRLAAAEPAQVWLHRLPQNGGKGAAMVAGFREAARRGYKRALQIDADGQHDPAQIPQFIEAGHDRARVVCGVPRYDASVPKARLYGRYLTHVWVWINTLSFALRDSMCGFRIYPLAPVLRLIDEERIGRRMDFDTEILVRLFWRDVPVVHVETPVTYPSDGVSHFDVWRDNVRITAMHARLFFGMLRRLPRLLLRKVRA